MRNEIRMGMAEGLLYCENSEMGGGGWGVGVKSSC